MLVLVIPYRLNTDHSDLSLISTYTKSKSTVNITMKQYHTTTIVSVIVTMLQSQPVHQLTAWHYQAHLQMAERPHRTNAGELYVFTNGVIIY